MVCVQVMVLKVVVIVNQYDLLFNNWWILCNCQKWGSEVTLKVVLQTSMVLLRLVVVMVVTNTKQVVLQGDSGGGGGTGPVAVTEELTDMMVVLTQCGQTLNYVQRGGGGGGGGGILQS